MTKERSGLCVSTYLKLELLSHAVRDRLGQDDRGVSTYLKLELLSHPSG